MSIILANMIIITYLQMTPRGIYRECMRETSPNPRGLICLGLSLNNMTYKIGGLFYVQTPSFCFHYFRWCSLSFTFIYF